jgi:hypothetical protein
MHAGDQAGMLLFICILRGYKVIQCSDNIESDYIFIDSINRRAVIQ